MCSPSGRRTGPVAPPVDADQPSAGSRSYRPRRLKPRLDSRHPGTVPGPHVAHASRREEFTTTSRLLEAIATAANSGFNSPSAASGMATAL
jgi:hypothetical protein